MADKETADVTSEPEVNPSIIFKKRSTKTTHRRAVTIPPPAPTHNLSDSDELSSTDRNVLHANRKRRKTASLVAAPSKLNTAPETEFSKGAHPADPSTTLLAAGYTVERYPVPNDLLGFRTSSGITTDDMRKKQQMPSCDKKSTLPTKTLGPTRAPTNVRTTIIVDFQPDVCKDYKKTGYCGFGDSCKFLHAREDYKQGWQLSQEWEKMKGRGENGIVAGSDGNGETAATDIDQSRMPRHIPSACSIYKELYRSPIATSCGHIFCESCALQRYKRDASCAVCGVDTGGVFKSAKRLLKRQLDHDC